MRSSTLMILAALSGTVAIAQQPLAPRTPPTGATLATSTNAVQPYVELREVQAKLFPLEQKILDNDAEIKALLLQRKDAQKLIEDLDKKRRALVEAKLMADPNTAPLAQKRKELMEKIQAMRAVPGVPITNMTADPVRPGGLVPRPIVPTP